MDATVIIIGFLCMLLNCVNLLKYKKFKGFEEEIPTAPKINPTISPYEREAFIGELPREVCEECCELTTSSYKQPITNIRKELTEFFFILLDHNKNFEIISSYGYREKLKEIIAYIKFYYIYLNKIKLLISDNLIHVPKEDLNETYVFTHVFALIKYSLEFLEIYEKFSTVYFPPSNHPVKKVEKKIREIREITKKQTKKTPLSFISPFFSLTTDFCTNVIEELRYFKDICNCILGEIYKDRV